MPVIPRQRVDAQQFVNNGTVRTINSEVEPTQEQENSRQLLARPKREPTIHSSYRMAEITHKRLALLKHRTGVPIGEWIDRAVAVLYAQVKDQLPPEEDIV